MALPLRSGDPPESDDPGLIDAGSFTPTRELSNAPGSDLAGDIDMYGAFGMKVPPWAQVREVLRKTRDVPTPYFCKVRGLGTLYVSEDGWEVR